MPHEPTRRPDGSIMHAQVKIGNSLVMIAEESEMAKATSSTLYLYVPNVDEVYKRAVKAGGQSVMEPSDMFYGDRSGGVKDPVRQQLVRGDPQGRRRPHGARQARRGVQQAAAEEQGGLSGGIRRPHLPPLSS